MCTNVAGSLLNFHEGVRTQATSYGHTARRVRLEHEALSYVFKNWEARTRDAVQLYWGGKILRSSKVYLAAVVVDHPQLDKFVGGGE